MSAAIIAAVGGLAISAYSAYDAHQNRPKAPSGTGDNSLQQDTQFDTINPAGSSIFTTDPKTGERTNTSTYSPENQALYTGLQGAHGSNADLANALTTSQGGNIGAGYTPIGGPPKGTPGQTVIQTDPTSAFNQFQNTGVLPAGYGVDSNGKLVYTGGGGGPSPVSTKANTSTTVGTDAPGDSGGGSGMQSPTGTQSVTGPDGGPVYGTTYGNSNNAAYLEAMGVKPAVAAQDLYAWQAAHPDGTPMPRGWTLEGSIGQGGGIGGGTSSQYKAGTLGQTVGAAPTLGTVGSADKMARMDAAIPQGQTVTQAQALAQMQAPDKIANFNTGVNVQNIAGYNGAAPNMQTTKAPGTQQQFTGQAPTAQMIANGGSVAGAGEGIQKNLDLSNLGNMPTASEATLKQVQDALYARQTGYLDPQYQAEQAQLNARLANQGIGIGARANTLSQAAEASAREKAYAGARNDAILAGGAEQSRLFNMQMAARQQGYTEDLGMGNFQNAAQGQGYGQQLANQQNVIAGTSANNQAQNAQLAAQMAIMQQNNAAKQTDFTNQFNITGQNNAAQQALGQYNLGAGTLNANIGNMNANNQLGLGQLNLGAGQLNANIAQNNFANQLATNQFNNQATTGNLNNQLAATGFNNQVGQQAFTNTLNQNTFNNTAAQQDFANQLSSQGFNNTAANQGFQNNLAGTGFNNAVQQQDVTNQFSQQGLNINAAQAAAQMAQAKASAASAAGSVAAANAARQQQAAQYQQSFTASQNQQAFLNYMATQGFNNGVTNTGNNLDLSAYQAGISGNNSNIAGNNSNVNNLIALQNASGPVPGVGLPPIGGGTSNATQQGYMDANGNYQTTNQNNNMMLNSLGQLVPVAVNAYNNRGTTPNYNTYGTGPGSPQYGGPGGG